MAQTATFPGIEFDHENARIYAEYWASLPKVDLIPMRSSFDPADLVEILPNFVIHDMVSPDFIRVRLVKQTDGWAAEPIFGKSGLISTLVEADGLLRVDRNTEGLYQGDLVDVMVFD